MRAASKRFDAAELDDEEPDGATVRGITTVGADRAAMT
jgi:hypothetical protein